jgi:hypothetical protein
MCPNLWYGTNLVVPTKKRNPSIKSYDEIGDEDIESDDRKKLREAFKLLDDFVSSALNHHKSTFQFIVLEHVSPEFFEDMQNFHLVEDFRGGNALIPLDEIQEDESQDEPEDEMKSEDEGF